MSRKPVFDDTAPGGRGEGVANMPHHLRPIHAKTPLRNETADTLNVIAHGTSEALVIGLVEGVHALGDLQRRWKAYSLRANWEQAQEKEAEKKQRAEYIRQVKEAPDRRIPIQRGKRLPTPQRPPGVVGTGRVTRRDRQEKMQKIEKIASQMKPRDRERYLQGMSNNGERLLK